MVHTGPVLRQRAQGLRRAQTRSENRIWSWLRDRRCLGYKFRRQFPIDRYILDFYCAELKLASELDGEQHDTPWMREYDGERSLYLADSGIEVLRIPNVLLIRDSLLVSQMIRAAIDSCVRAKER